MKSTRVDIAWSPGVEIRSDESAILIWELNRFCLFVIKKTWRSLSTDKSRPFLSFFRFILVWIFQHNQKQNRNNNFRKTIESHWGYWEHSAPSTGQRRLVLPYATKWLFLNLKCSSFIRYHCQEYARSIKFLRKVILNTY